MRAISDLTAMAKNLNIAPETLVKFPDDVRANVQHLLKSTLTAAEMNWMRSIVEPFHPVVTGARAPSNTPKETVSYNHFTSLQCTEDSLYIINYEMQLLTPLVQIRGDLLNILNDTMVRVGASFGPEYASDQSASVLAFNTVYTKA